MISTEEQELIYSCCRAPTRRESPDELEKPSVVRITAGAGTGKTTTILNLASKAAEKGHTYITYVTFSKAAAADGQQRIGASLARMTIPPIVDARTLHSCAMKLLGEQRKEEDTEEQLEAKIWDQSRMEKYIQDVCKDEMD